MRPLLISSTVAENFPRPRTASRVTNQAAQALRAIARIAVRRICHGGLGEAPVAGSNATTTRRVPQSKHLPTHTRAPTNIPSTPDDKRGRAPKSWSARQRKDRANGRHDRGRARRERPAQIRIGPRGRCTTSKGVRAIGSKGGARIVRRGAQQAPDEPRERNVSPAAHIIPHRPRHDPAREQDEVSRPRRGQEVGFFGVMASLPTIPFFCFFRPDRHAAFKGWRPSHSRKGVLETTFPASPAGDA